MKSCLFHCMLLGAFVLMYASCQTSAPSEHRIWAEKDEKTGQIIIRQGNDIVLQYNYQTVFEKDVIHLKEAKPENYTRGERDTFITTARYAVPRSNYIHPIYGLQGEMLTRDWPDGVHPHHRGIFWAWPEVEFGSKKGDIYALQTVFARPTGKIELKNEAGYSQITAENEWKWEDRESIVLETAIIKVHEAQEQIRIIDLALRFIALKDSITIATRYTDSYGGLNLRMQTPDGQSIHYHTDEPGSPTVRAWSDFTGTFAGASTETGMAVLQHTSNPEYPGRWQDYPKLAWVQPTFPTPDTRFSLKPGKSLDLRYRIVVHKGGKQASSVYQEWWDDYHRDETVLSLLKDN